MRYLQLLSFLLLISCSVQKELTIDGQTVSIYRPPGTIEIAENFYADETEMDNIGYKEYLFWIKQIYGSDSEKYQELLPDTTVWAEEFNSDFGSIYLNHPTYDNYPLVGITLEQAKKYTDWRTERVTEMILVMRKIIRPNPNATPENYFTIERYLDGSFDWIIVKSDFVAVPKYKLPNAEEWEFIAKGNSEFELGIDQTTKFNRKVLKKNRFVFNTQEYFKDEKNKEFDKEKKNLKNRTAFIYDFSKNINGLYSTIGNVAELTEEGKTKGGSWKDQLADIAIEKFESFDTPNCWTGFRNICQWEIRKAKK